MATSSVRQLRAGEERSQMLELNRRLESYLGHVKLLEEENHLLWGEIQALRRSSDTNSPRQAQEEALRQARREVQAAWMEKDCAELEMSTLQEEVEKLNAQRQIVKAAQVEAKRRLQESRSELEDERRAQIWLREQAAYLEKEVSLQVQVYQEDITALKSSFALWKPVPAVPHETQGVRLQGLGEEYSQRAAQLWQEAADAYQGKVAELEENLEQIRVQMARLTQEKRERQLQEQDLAKELISMKAKRELLEKNVVQLKDRQMQELLYLQTQVQTLEAEKEELGVQIDILLVDRRNLQQLKMSLGVEVAAYRALLDSESPRLGPSGNRTSTRTISVLDTLTKPRGTHLNAQTISDSCQFGTLLTTGSRSMTYAKAKPMSTTLSWSLPRITPQETPKRAQTTVVENGCISEETVKVEGSSTAGPPKNSSHSRDLEDANEEGTYVASDSTSPVPTSADEPESMFDDHVGENMPENQAEATEVTLLSSPAGHMSSLLQTPETEAFPDSHSHTDTEEEEETEVSTEMAQISHAPRFDGEENDVVVPEEKDAASETELESESISEHNTQDFRIDNESSGLEQHAESTNEVASPSSDESSEISTWVGEQEIVSNLSTEVSLERAGEMKKESTDKWEGTEGSDVKEETEVAHSGPQVWDGYDAVSVMQMEENKTDKWEGMERSEDAEEKREVICSGTEVWDAYHADTAVQEEVNKMELEAEKGKVEESKEAEVKIRDEEEKRMMEEDVTDENVANTESSAMKQDSFVQEVDPQESVENPEVDPQESVENPEVDPQGSGEYSEVDSHESMENPEVDPQECEEYPEIDSHESVETPEVDLQESVEYPEIDSHECVENPEVDPQGIMENTEVDPHESVENPEIDSHESVENPEVDPHESVENPEIDSHESVENPEVDPHESVENPEIDSHESVENPEVNPQGSGEYSEVDSHGSGEYPEIDPQGSKENLEVDPQGIMENPEVDPQGIMENPEVDPQGSVECPEETVESGVESNNKDHSVVEEHTEEEQREGDEEVSSNICASWRADPGETDSYTHIIDPHGIAENPDVDPQGSVENLEVDPQVSVENPEVDPQENVEHPQIDPQAGVEYPEETAESEVEPNNKDHSVVEEHTEVEQGEGDEEVSSNMCAPRRADAGETDSYTHDIDAHGSAEYPEVDPQGSVEHPEVDTDGSVENPEVAPQGSVENPEVDSQGSGEYSETDPQGSMENPEVDPHESVENPEVDPQESGKCSEVDSHGSGEYPEIDPQESVENPEVDPHESVENPEVDPHDSVENPEIDSRESVEKAEVDPHESVENPEIDSRESVEKAEVDPQMSVEYPETDPQGSMENPEVDPHESVENPEIDSHESVENPEVNPQGSGEYSEVDSHGSGEYPEIDPQGSKENLEVDPQESVENPEVDSQGSVEYPKETVESGVESNNKDHSVVEEHTEVEQREGDEEVPSNICASWRADSGETDSYTHIIDPHGMAEIPGVDSQGSVENPEVDPQGSSEYPEVDSHESVENLEVDPQVSVKNPEVDPQENVEYPQVDPQAGVEYPEETAESEVEPNNKDHSVVEEHTEVEQREGDEEVSSNMCAPWRADPGETDSYTHDIDPHGSAEYPEVDPQGSVEHPEVDTDGSVENPEIDSHESVEKPEIDPQESGKCSEVDSHGSGEYREIDPQGSKENLEVDPQGSVEYPKETVESGVESNNKDHSVVEEHTEEEQREGDDSGETDSYTHDIDPQGSAEYPEVDPEGSVEHPKVDLQGSVENPEVDPQESVENPEVDPQESVENPEVDPQESVENPEVDPQESVENPEVDPQESVENPEVDPQESVENPEVDLQGSVEYPKETVESGVESNNKDHSVVEEHTEEEQREGDDSGETDSYTHDIDPQGSAEYPEVDPQGSVEHPKVDLQGSVENPEVDPQESVENPEVDPQESVENPEVDPQESVENPEVDLQGSVEYPKVDHQGSVENPEADPQGSVEYPEFDLQGEVEYPEVDTQGSVENPEADPQGSVEYPEVNYEGGVEYPEVDTQGSVENPEVHPHGSVEYPEADPQGSVEYPEVNYEGGVEYPEVDTQGSVEYPEETAESEVKPHNKDHSEVEEHTEEEQRESDEEVSSNICASWRTDPGEADSYTQENTLADTRPLIHYKSDEETDANTQVSHVEASECSDSEEESERQEGVGHWSQNASKRFDTMEDLSEEPEMDKPDDAIPDSSIQTETEGPEVLTESMDETDREGPVLLEGVESESGDTDHQVNILIDNALVDSSEGDPQNNCEEIHYHGEKIEVTEENNHIVLVEKQKESSHECGESFSSETWEIPEQKNIPAKQPSSSEDDSAITNDNKETCNVESFSQIESEGEGVTKTSSENVLLVTDTPLPETFFKQVQAEEPCEMSIKEPTHLDVFPIEKAMTKEQAYPKEENDEKSNLSVPTHPDFTDNLSLHSELSNQPDSQTNIAELDLEESNSSADESPNSSQCSQYFIQTGMPAEQPSSGLQEETMSEEVGRNSSEDCMASLTEQQEDTGSQNKEEQGDAVDNSTSDVVKIHSSLSEVEEQQDLDQFDETIGVAHTSVEKLGVVPTIDDKASDMMDIFQDKFLSEESVTKEKEDDPHSFFTSSIREGARNMMPFEMAATAEPEGFSSDPIHPNQSMMFEDDWGDVGSLPPANGKPEKELGISLTQSEGEKVKEEEQRIPKTKQLQCTDVREGEVLTVQSDISTDDGDSWSSGEE